MQRADAPGGSVGWTVGLIAAGAVAMWVFGPALELRRGVALRPADADQYISAAQNIRLALDVTERAAPRLRVESTPEPDRGPRFRRRITASLASRGPSERGAGGLTTFVAQWNLDGAHVRAATRPVLRGSTWVWDATLTALPDSLTVRLWPVTWVSESHVERLRIRGEGVRVGALDLDGDSSYVWSRPADLSAIDSFPVLIGRR